MSETGNDKRRCHRERFSVHASIANYQNEARSGLCVMRQWRELAPDQGPTALGSGEPIGQSAPTRRDRIASWPKTKPSSSSHNKRPFPEGSIRGRAPFESSAHCTWILQVSTDSGYARGSPFSRRALSRCSISDLYSSVSSSTVSAPPTGSSRPDPSQGKCSPSRARTRSTNV